SFLQIMGWVILGDVTTQRVRIELFNKADSLSIPCIKIANTEVMEYFKSKDLLMSGFEALIPLKEVPSGDYAMGISVENKNQSGFLRLDKKINPDSLRIQSN